MASKKVVQLAVARHAMATRFEIVLHGQDQVALRAAGEEALDEIERLENQLSLYRQTSEVAQLNARASNESVRVEPGLFRLLRHAQRLFLETEGAFDITIGPLMKCWGFMGQNGRVPTPHALRTARAQVGMRHVALNPDNFTVRFKRPGMMLDLGAIGKGYAVERAAQLLREAGVRSALLHGGTSTIYALGHPPREKAWKVAVEYPGTTEDAPPTLLAVVSLADEALSISAVWGKSFQTAGKTYGHVIDPRTGRPASKAVLAAAVLPSATESDAFSTALLTVGSLGHDQIALLRPDMRTLVLDPGKTGFHLKTSGIVGFPLPKHLGAGAARPCKSNGDEPSSPRNWGK